MGLETQPKKKKKKVMARESEMQQMSWAMNEEIRQSEIRSLSVMEKKASEDCLLYCCTIWEETQHHQERYLKVAKTTTGVFKILYLVEIPDSTMMASTRHLVKI